MEHITTIPDTNKLPWYKQVNPDKQAYMKEYKERGAVKAIEDLALPAIYHVGEIIHSDDKPPQVRLQACQLVLNKVIGDKIDITQQKQVVDVNKLLDQLVTLKSLDSNTRDITPSK